MEEPVVYIRGHKVEVEQEDTKKQLLLVSRNMELSENIKLDR